MYKIIYAIVIKSIVVVIAAALLPLVVVVANHNITLIYDELRAGRMK